MGCWDSLILKPCWGSSSLGAVMFTPAIGPATEGLSGLVLFFASHPASAHREGGAQRGCGGPVCRHEVPRVRVVRWQVCSGGSRRQTRLSAASERNYRGAWITGRKEHIQNRPSARQSRQSRLPHVSYFLFGTCPSGMRRDILERFGPERQALLIGLMAGPQPLRESIARLSTSS